ncbi:PHP domain-containing protein [Oceanimonas pelagia]|uniref:PHP domain-containing protein n=1 Tax=Oceanimonas pelagia TaxID=3028314 RepID=A0AA50Q931_9GAMM|nr:PHP domain-containing protein [Oceanimonas pelagia]WMC09398.1 PHP domain-containing protein [Oceanimonas pelagia]
MRIDLHSHSTASDGSLSPGELLARAAEKEVDVLALTDHDTVAGLAEAQAAADEHGIRLVTGVEISALWQHKEIHVVGLNLDPAHSGLTQLLADQAARRDARARLMGERLEKARYPGAYEGARAIAGEAAITRTHLARWLLAQGAADSMGKVFKKFLSRGNTGYAPPDWCSLEEAIDTIQAAGGVAVLAHPTRYDLSNKWIRNMLTAFAGAGGDAMEVSMAQQSPQERATLGKWSKEYGLAASVGSDFHFPSQWRELGRQLWLPKEATPVWERFL